MAGAGMPGGGASAPAGGGPFLFCVGAGDGLLSGLAFPSTAGVQPDNNVAIAAAAKHRRMETVDTYPPARYGRQTRPSGGGE